MYYNVSNIGRESTFRKSTFRNFLEFEERRGIIKKSGCDNRFVKILCNRFAMRNMSVCDVSTFQVTFFLWAEWL